jgi:hypothetical protein
MSGWTINVRMVECFDEDESRAPVNEHTPDWLPGPESGL